MPEEKRQEEKETPNKARPLTQTEQVELEENSVKRIAGFLRKLDTWQKESVSTAIRH